MAVKNMVCRFAMGIAVLLYAGAGHAEAAPKPSSFLALGDKVEAPRGFVEMCRQDDSTFCLPGSKRDGGDGDGAMSTGGLAGSASAESWPAVPHAVPVSAVPALLGVQLTTHVFDCGVASLPTSLAAGLPLPIVTSVARPQTAALAAAGSGLWSPVVVAVMPPSAGIDEVSRAACGVETATGDDHGLLALGLLALGRLASPSPEPSHASLDPAPGLVPDQTLLKRINRYVNGRVSQRTDEQIYGRNEVWRRSGIDRHAAGDCEDIAIEKRYELIDAGVAPDHLSFAVVYSTDAGLHTVLVARTAEGDYVLDSRSGSVMPWYRAPYVWISVQSSSDLMTWYAPASSAA